MIIELSKDQSFYGVLNKAELDKETTELVKQEASPIEIKMSLLKNLNSSNMVKYRRYIKKADEEEEELSRREEDEMRSEQEGAKVQGDIVDESSLLEESDVQSTIRSDLLEKDRETKAYNFLADLSSQLPSLKLIAEDAKVIRSSESSQRNYEVRGVMRPYLKIANSKKKSNQIVNLFKVLELEPTFFTKRFGEMLVNGKLTGKQFSKDKDTEAVTYEESKKDINVDALAAEFNKLKETKIEVLDSENMKTFSEISFREVFEQLHVQKHRRLPSSSMDRKRRGAELRRIQRRLNEGITSGGDREINREYRKAKQLVTKHRRKVTKLRGNKSALESSIEDLEKLLENSEGLVARKFNELNNALKVLLSSGRNVANIREKTAEIRDLQNNKEKYIKEAKSDVEKTIADEKVKLSKYKADLTAAIRTEAQTKEFMTQVDSFSGMKPIDEIKALIIEGLNACSEMNQVLTKIEREAAKAENNIAEGSIAYASSNPDARWESVGGEMEFIGLPTIDNQAIRAIDGHLQALDSANAKLAEVNTNLKTKIEGKTPESMSMEEEQ